MNPFDEVLEPPPRIVVLAHHEPGEAVVRYLENRREAPLRVYVTPKTKGLTDAKVWPMSALEDPAHVAELRLLGVGWLVAVYWPKVLPSELLRIARKGTINFHPSLLPINRGWHPYVHNILDGSPAGVTLHEMTNNADAGRIWAQRRVEVSPYDTSYALDLRLQREIVDLFRETWPDIVAENIKPTPQQGEGNWHNASEVYGTHELDLDAMSARDLLRALRAYSFGEEGYAFHRVGDRNVYLNLRLGPKVEFGGNP